MRARSALVLVSLLVCPMQARAGVWTIGRVLDAVREHDPGLRAALAAGSAGRAAAGERWAALAPQVTASAGFTRGDDPAILFTQKLWQGRFASEDFALEALNHPAARSAFQLGITVDQPIWDGGRELSAPALAGHDARAAAALERAAVADHLLAAAECWTEVVRSREALRSSTRAFDSARAMRDAAAERH